MNLDRRICPSSRAREERPCLSQSYLVSLSTDGAWKSGVYGRLPSRVEILAGSQISGRMACYPHVTMGDGLDPLDTYQPTTRFLTARRRLASFSEKGFNRAGECRWGRWRPFAAGGRGSGIPSVPVYVSHSMALDPDRGGIELLSRSDDPPTPTQKERREGGSGTGSKEAASSSLPRRRQIVAFAAGPKWITAVGHPAFPLGRLMKGFHEEKAPRPPRPPHALL